jgi:hypothetical protein
MTTGEQLRARWSSLKKARSLERVSHVFFFQRERKHLYTLAVCAGGRRLARARAGARRQRRRVATAAAHQSPPLVERKTRAVTKTHT